MTEGEKRALALSIFEAEKQRLRNRSPLNYHTYTKLAASLARSERQPHAMDSLAQNGITWDQLKAAYDEAVDQGKRDMVQLNMGYFYAGMAIAFKRGRYIRFPPRRSGTHGRGKIHGTGYPQGRADRGDRPPFFRHPTPPRFQRQSERSGSCGAYEEKWNHREGSGI